MRRVVISYLPLVLLFVIVGVGCWIVQATTRTIGLQSLRQDQRRQVELALTSLHFQRWETNVAESHLVRGLIGELQSSSAQPLESLSLDDESLVLVNSREPVDPGERALLTSLVESPETEVTVHDSAEEEYRYYQHLKWGQTCVGCHFAPADPTLVSLDSKPVDLPSRFVSIATPAQEADALLQPSRRLGFTLQAVIVAMGLLAGVAMLLQRRMAKAFNETNAASSL